MIRKLAVLAFFALACVVAWPTLTYAQSAIAGVVKDSSGAVLPGVSVEASSDALIEKVRAVVTDETGQYKIIDLRPGCLRRHLHAHRIQHVQKGRYRPGCRLHRAGQR